MFNAPIAELTPPPVAQQLTSQADTGNLSGVLERLQLSLSSEQGAAEERIRQTVRDCSRLNEEALTIMARPSEMPAPLRCLLTPQIVSRRIESSSSSWRRPLLPYSRRCCCQASSGHAKKCCGKFTALSKLALTGLRSRRPRSCPPNPRYVWLFVSRLLSANSTDFFPPVVVLFASGARQRHQVRVSDAFVANAIPH